MFIPKFLASCFASSKDDSGLYFDGIATPMTRSGVNASQAIVAVKAESIPPDSPTSTLLNLFFVT